MRSNEGRVQRKNATVSWAATRRAEASILGHRAGLGEVRIQLFDDPRVLLLDDAAFELQGECEAPVVEGEVVGKQSETLDGLILSEMRGQALHFPLDELMHKR